MENNRLIENSTITKGKVWYAEINGRIFKNSTGHAFFWRKCDLVRSLKQSNIRIVVREAANSFFDTFKAEEQRRWTSKQRQEAIDIFWNSYVGERPKFPCQIKCIDLEDFD